MVLTADKQILYCCTDEGVAAVTKYVLNAEAGKWERDRRLPSAREYLSTSRQQRLICAVIAAPIGLCCPATSLCELGARMTNS